MADLDGAPFGMERRETGNAGPRKQAMLRKVAYIFLILLFVLSSVLIFTVITGINQAEKRLVDPVGDLVRQLIVPVTPVILPNPTTIVRQINTLSRLETASVDLEKVFTAERNSEALWGLLGESMVFVAYGRVVAGVDFDQMSPADLQVVDPNTVWIHLPDATLFDDLPALDNEKSFVADRDTGLLTRADPQLESNVRRLAEATIREEALSTGVLEKADQNAQQYMLQFLQSLGFQNVEFFDEAPPVPPDFAQEVPKGFVLTPIAP
jgi:hypothetical protein